MSTQTFAEAITTRTADRGMFPTVPDEVGLDAYAVLTDDSGSWILTTAESAEALDLEALPGADLTSNTEGEYSEYWEEIASSVDVVSDCNSSTVTAAKAICAREGVAMIED